MHSNVALLFGFQEDFKYFFYYSKKGRLHGSTYIRKIQLAYSEFGLIFLKKWQSGKIIFLKVCSGVVRDFFGKGYHFPNLFRTTLEENTNKTPKNQTKYEILFLIHEKIVISEMCNFRTMNRYAGRN